MGLDLVEFIIATEDAFGIFIPDADAVDLTTPGRLIDYLEARLGQGESISCLEQRAFYRLRTAGMRVLDLPRDAFRPSTRWVDLLHANLHARQWVLVGQATGLTPWPRFKPLLSNADGG